MKKISYILGMFSLLILFGAGCTDNGEQTTDTNTPNSRLAGTQDDTQTDTTDSIGATSNGELTLSAQISGKGTVSFEWTPNDELSQKAESWRIVYGTETNPTYPSLWWFERGKPHREKVWSGLPAGTAHFRLCAVVDDTCTAYSNDVEVDIQ